MKKKKGSSIIQLRDKLNDNHVFANENFSRMEFLRIKVTDYISNDFPGFVRAEFRDVEGKLLTIEEKVPVLSKQDWDENIAYPFWTLVPGLILERRVEISTTKTEKEIKRKIIKISLEKPWGIYDTNNETIFEVFDEDVVG